MGGARAESSEASSSAAHDEYEEEDEVEEGGRSNAPRNPATISRTTALQEFPKGTAVTIIGVSDAVDGRSGEVLAYVEASQRYRIRSKEPEHSLFFLRGENLRHASLDLSSVARHVTQCQRSSLTLFLGSSAIVVAFHFLIIYIHGVGFVLILIVDQLVIVFVVIVVIQRHLWRARSWIAWCPPLRRCAMR